MLQKVNKTLKTAYKKVGECGSDVLKVGFVVGSLTTGTVEAFGQSLGVIPSEVASRVGPKAFALFATTLGISALNSYVENKTGKSILGHIFNRKDNKVME